MAIQGFTQEQFERTLNEYVSPSSPIESFEHLVGRQKQLEKIEEAIISPGRHIFIYGDRGAGKTSLARTAAYKHHPANGEPVYTACGRGTTFGSIVRDIVSQLDNRSELRSVDRTLTAGGKALGLEGSYSETEKAKSVDNLDLNAATAAVNEAALRRQGRSIIVVDEFENLPTVEDRHLFAELIKQLSDRRVPVAMVFCGIGKSLDSLLQGHNSAHRYLEEIALPAPPLTFTGCWEIVDSASGALGLKIEDTPRLRIAQISDGFPHYVHLICQKLCWRAFREQEIVEELTSEFYMDAVRDALTSVESRLRSAYDRATKKDSDSYEEVLWAVADHFELQRNNRRIYDESYLRIMEEVQRRPLDFAGFQSHLTKLRSPPHGAILEMPRRGWVQFSENLIRGYVRLVAESKGVRLALEHEPGPEPRKLTASARSHGVHPAYQGRRYTWNKPR